MSTEITLSKLISNYEQYNMERVTVTGGSVAALTHINKFSSMQLPFFLKYLML